MNSRPVAQGEADELAYFWENYPTEEYLIYYPMASGDENLERWSIDRINFSLPTFTHNFPLPALYLDDTDLQAVLRITVLGSVPLLSYHRAEIVINNESLGGLEWDGPTWHTDEFTVPLSLLKTTNTFEVKYLDLVGTSNKHTFYIYRVQLDFPSAFTVEENRLSFSYEQPGVWQFSVQGFTGDDLAVFDVSNPLDVVQITGFSVDSEFYLSFQDEISARTDYFTTATTAYRQDASIALDTASNLRGAANEADYIVITHADFWDQAERLSEHRASEWRTVAVDVQDIYDEFSYGIVGPEPIRDFLAHAFAYWEKPAPSFVVLLGDGHYDPNYYIRERMSFIPPYLTPVDPWSGETAGDNRYVSDLMPDTMLGRMAVNTADETEALINKILAFESSSGDGLNTVLAVADKKDSAGNFPLLSDNLLTCCLPSAYQAVKGYRGLTHTTGEELTQAIMDEVNNGKLLVNYFGHGYYGDWGEPSFFGTPDLGNLSNQQYPIVLTMTCGTGYYIYPYRSDENSNRDSFAEVITRLSNKGAVAS